MSKLNNTLISATVAFAVLFGSCATGFAKSYSGTTYANGTKHRYIHRHYTDAWPYPQRNGDPRNQDPTASPSSSTNCPPATSRYAHNTTHKTGTQGANHGKGGNTTGKTGSQSGNRGGNSNGNSNSGRGNSGNSGNSGHGGHNRSMLELTAAQ